MQGCAIHFQSGTAKKMLPTGQLAERLSGEPERSESTKLSAKGAGVGVGGVAPSTRGSGRRL